MVSSGQMDQLMSHWSPELPKNSYDEWSPLTTRALQIIFIILGTFMGVSIVIFAIEISSHQIPNLYKKINSEESFVKHQVKVITINSKKLSLRMKNQSEPIKY